MNDRHAESLAGRLHIQSGGSRLARRLLGAAAASVLASAAPCAAEPLSRDVLPLPDQSFQGVVAETPAGSRPDWPRRLEAPAGAPNVLLVMTDDVGFAASSAFGGPIPTPNLERLAQQGLRFNRFHTTAICSPSRAALLTGRNAHQVGVGELIDFANGYPGANGVIPQSAASVARVLQLNGYSTAMFGKHHLVPRDQQSAAGPFTQWPTGLGFDYFYGFFEGDVHQWRPRLYRGTSFVDEAERQGEVLDQRLADDAISWIHNQKAAAPDKPFMIYLATGSLHAPHQAPMDWIARFKGRFDQGWDQVRQETYARQLATGVIPKGTKLTPRPDQIPAWSSLASEDRRYAARMMEVAAGELAFQDAQFGRIVDELDRMGELNNTLVIFVEGDNGASGEGAPSGLTNEIGTLGNNVQDSKAWLASQIPQMGGPATYENYPIGWAWALDTPFKWTKQFASYLGGIRNGLVVAWPGHIKDPGHIRSQFSHLVDITPTILDAAGIEPPKTVFGVAQKPFDGVSLLPWIAGDAPERPRTQYFQITAGVGIYHDGWFAGSPTGRMPWEFKPPQTVELKARPWELYDLRTDFSQAHDLAKAKPGKLAEMQAIFDAEAARNQVLPLDDRFGAARIAGSPRPQTRPARTVFDYWSSDTSVVQAAAPSFAGRSFTVDAEVRLADVASGVVVATGSLFGGWSFFLDHGRAVAVHAFSQKPEDTTRIAAAAPLAPGAHQLRFAFRSDGGPYAAGVLQISDGDKVLAEGRVPKTLVVAAGLGETFDIGRDTGVPVTAYATPAGALQGEVRHVRVSLGGAGR